jgi:hypothetical protein
MADRYELEKPKGQFLVYRAEDGTMKIDVRLEDETVWLTQPLMAELFQTTQQNISQHISSTAMMKRATGRGNSQKFFQFAKRTPGVKGIWYTTIWT